MGGVVDPSRPALHIDRLDLSQVHADAPDWGSAIRVDYDLKTGEVLQSVVKSDQLKGSWESSLLVRCTGGLVQVQGNPSKWGRLEAVGRGCASVLEGVEVYNRVLAQVGLPVFQVGERLLIPGSDGGCERLAPQCPRIQWVHIAANLRLGSAAAVGPYFDWLATQRVGKRGQELRSVGPLSVRAGTRRRRQVAMYSKAEEVREELSRWRRKRRCDDRDAVSAYLGELAARLEAEGWVRREVRLAGDYLADKGLQWVDAWSAEAMLNEWQEYGVVTGEVATVSDWKTEVYDRLLVRGLGERAARQRVETLLAWMSGVEVGPGNGRSRRSFYRIAADLREVVGVDIRSRPNVVTLGSRIQRVARPVEARIATVADVEALYAGLGDLSRAA